MSHIVPRWMHRWMKQEGDVIFEDRSRGLRLTEQDGAKHYLLCSACEQHLGVSERYMRLLMDEEQRAWPDLGLSEIDDVISGVDETLVERFLLGVLLKAHFASSYYWIAASARLVSRLRLRLLGRGPALPARILAARFHSHVAPDIDPRAIVWVDFVAKPRLPMFSLMAAGWEWLVFYDYYGDFSKLPLSEFLQDGRVYAPWGDVTVHRRFPRRLAGTSS